MDLEARILALVAAAAGTGAGVVSFDQVLDEDLGIASLDRVDLVLSAEEEFGCEIADGDVERIKTVRDLRDVVRQSAA